MKTIISIALLFIAANCWANKIDSLTSKKQVNDFLIENIDTSFHKYYVFGSKTDHGTDSFYKVDINSDGLTDLVLDAHESIIIIDKGAGRYEKFYVPDYRYIKSIKLGNVNALVYYDSFWSDRNGKIGSVDTIIYKYGILFVHHTVKYKHKINKIYYGYAECNGPDCPTYNIEIHDDGFAFLDFGRIKFIGRINDSLLNAINDEINALDIDMLSNQYKINWDNKLDAKLEVWYDDDKHKQMQDEDMAYSLHLNGICEMFKELLDMDLWKPWYIDSLNDSSYLSFSQLFRDAHNPNMNWYTTSTYKDTASEKKTNAGQPQRFVVLDTMGVDPFDTVNIWGNQTFLFETVAFLELNNDHSFVYGRIGERPMVSAGFWNNQNDTIELNWSLDKTLSIIRNNTLKNLYFEGWVSPIPLTIEKWKLIYDSKNRKILHGLRAKKDEELYRR